MRPAPVTLEGDLVRLEPLTAEHLDALCAAGLDEEVWRWNPFPVGTRDEMARYLDTALDWQARAIAVPFATIDRATGIVAGSTRFANIDTTNRRVEIGWTWLGRRWWRTGINVEAKRLMLGHAFEEWGCVRVEFKTDALNERSRAAIAGLGATFEGILRSHMTTATERMRDSAYYSILAGEWPAVREALAARLRSNASPASIPDPRIPAPPERNRP